MYICVGPLVYLRSNLLNLRFPDEGYFLVKVNTVLYVLNKISLVEQQLLILYSIFRFGERFVDHWLSVDLRLLITSLEYLQIYNFLHLNVNKFLNNVGQFPDEAKNICVTYTHIINIIDECWKKNSIFAVTNLISRKIRYYNTSMKSLHYSSPLISLVCFVAIYQTLS